MLGIVLSVILAFGPAGNNWNWNSMGPDGGTVLSIAANPDGSSPIAVTFHNVWKYTGSTWTPVLTINGMSEVINTGQDSFCVINVNDSVMVFTSSDGGNTWSMSFSNQWHIESWSNINSKYIYLANMDSIYISSDGGYTWSTAPFPSLDPEISIIDLYVSYPKNHPSIVYLTFSGDSMGSNVFRIYKSSDFGQSWQIVHSDTVFGEVDAFLADPNDTNKLYFGMGISPDVTTPPGIYISEDGGVSLSYLITSLQAGILFAKDFKVYHDTLYVASMINPGIYKGYEIGGVWLFNKITTENYITYALHIASNGNLLAGISGGVLNSPDRATFTDITSGLKAVATSPLTGQIGTNHSILSNNHLYMVDGAFFEEYNGPIFSNVLYYSSDGGNTWSKRFIPGLLMPIGVQTSLNNPSVVYISGLGYSFDATGNITLHGIYRSNDYGATFTPTDPGFPLDSLLNFYDVTWVSPSDPNRILVKQFNLWDMNQKPNRISLLLSTDGGASFTALLHEIPFITTTHPFSGIHHTISSTMRNLPDAIVTENKAGSKSSQNSPEWVSGKSQEERSCRC